VNAEETDGAAANFAAGAAPGAQDRAQSFNGRSAEPGRFSLAFAFRQQQVFLMRQQLMPLAADSAGEKSGGMEVAASARPGASSSQISATAMKLTNRCIADATSRQY
jgi:hypothetical protein